MKTKTQPQPASAPHMPEGLQHYSVGQRPTYTDTPDLPEGLSQPTTTQPDPLHDLACEQFEQIAQYARNARAIDTLRQILHTRSTLFNPPKTKPDTIPDTPAAPAAPANYTPHNPLRCDYSPLSPTLHRRRPHPHRPPPRTSPRQPRPPTSPTTPPQHRPNPPHPHRPHPTTRLPTHPPRTPPPPPTRHPPGQLPHPTHRTRHTG